jgi:Xaa-Pro aminopeptidase
MRYNKIDANLFAKNRNKLADLINNGFAILESNYVYIRNGDVNHKYRQNSDFFYLTGIEQEESVLLLMPNHPDKEKREILFLTKPDKKTEIWFGKKLKKREASAISGIKTVYWLSELNSLIDDYISISKTAYIQTTINDNYIPISGEKIRKKLKIRKNVSLHCISQFMQEIRIIKEPEEIDLIKKAISITKLALDKVYKNIKPNIKEYELEAIITNEFIKNGASGHAYEPIIASGKNACILHYTENDKKCKDGDVVLFDFGAEYANYAADLSRTIPVNGEFTKRQQDIHDAVFDVQQKAIKLYIPGNTINDINKKVETHIEKKLISLGLFSKIDVKNQDPYNPLYKKYYMHGTAHFLGLDVHDIGTNEVIFKENMILTCEPGIYIKEEGIGVRIENDIIVGNPPIDLMRDF